MALGVLVALCVPFAVGGLIEAWRDSPTVDESIYVANGVTALTRHELRFNLEHPPLAKVLAALPVLAVHPVIPSTRSRHLTGGSFTHEFVTAQEKTGKLQRVFFLGRSVSVVEGILVGVAAYALAAGLFGRAAGLLAAGLWLTTGFVLGMGHLVGLDLPYALFTLLACLCLSRYLRRPSALGAVLVGLMGGLTLLTRVSGLLLIPVLALGVVAGEWRRLGRAVGMGAIVVLVAWASVWVGVRALAPSTAPVLNTSYFCFHRDSTTDRMVKRIPWPREYRAAVDFHLSCARHAGPSFLLGRHSTGASWWFWPGSMLVKLPPTVIAVLVAGLLCWVKLGRRTLRRAALAVGVPAAVLAIFTLTVPNPHPGLRFLLPVIALGMVAGSAVLCIVARRWLFWSLIGVIAIVQVPLLVQSFPHSLAWTAPPFRPGYRVANDSNLDWGQDFYSLESWSRRRRAFVAYYGPDIKNLPGTRELVGTDPRKVRGWVAVSATLLTANRRTPLSWLRAYCPVGTLSGSILLYRFKDPPDPTPGPVVPARPCRGGTSRRA